MKPTVYLETTIIGYLTARLSSELVTAANQKTTHEWWDNEREKFELFTSMAVIQECSAGDSAAVADRLEVLKDIPILAESIEAELLAQEIARTLQLPARVQTDALHIAVAAVHGMRYLLTWNCAHIANASLMERIQAACQSQGYASPILCTPQQLKVA